MFDFVTPADCAKGRQASSQSRRPASRPYTLYFLQEADSDGAARSPLRGEACPLRSLREHRARMPAEGGRGEVRGGPRGTEAGSRGPGWRGFARAGSHVRPWHGTWHGGDLHGFQFAQLQSDRQCALRGNHHIPAPRPSHKDCRGANEPDRAVATPSADAGTSGPGGPATRGRGVGPPFAPPPSRRRACGRAVAPPREEAEPGPPGRAGLWAEPQSGSAARGAWCRASRRRPCRRG